MAKENNSNIDEKIEEGQLLFNTILNNVHHGNIEEMYQYFKEKVQYIDSYGDTTEKKLINYCTYKGDLAIRMYKH